MAKILIVEDDKIILNMYRVKFSNAGHEVQIAENGKDGLQMMRSTHPDLVIMDLMMPIMDGFTALQEAKKDETIRAIPIVILTNLSQSEDAEKTLKMGATDFIIKASVTPQETLERITKYLPAIDQTPISDQN